MSCTKVRYPSSKKARRAAKIVSDDSGITMRPYPCPNCGGWHLSSMSPSEYQASSKAPKRKRVKQTRAFRARQNARIRELAREPLQLDRDGLERLAARMRGEEE